MFQIQSGTILGFKRAAEHSKFPQSCLHVSEFSTHSEILILQNVKSCRLAERMGSGYASPQTTQDTKFHRKGRGRSQDPLALSLTLLPSELLQAVQKVGTYFNAKKYQKRTKIHKFQQTCNIYCERDNKSRKKGGMEMEPDIKLKKEHKWVINLALLSNSQSGKNHLPNRLCPLAEKNWLFRGHRFNFGTNTIEEFVSGISQSR